MSSMTTSGSTLGVLARQEIRNYLRHKLFWFGAALVLLVDVVVLFDLDDDPSSSGSYMIAPAAMLGVLGLVVMFGLTRRSDRAAEAAGVVAVPERTRTLALASATSCRSRSHWCPSSRRSSPGTCTRPPTTSSRRASRTPSCSPRCSATA